MALTLTILRCPDAAAPERRLVAGGEYAIGRGPQNDWVLHDPEKYLSKKHCMLAYLAGEWHLTDLSANGTFVNRDARPLGQGVRRVLRHGDRIRLGAYEIEAAVKETVLATAWPPASRGAALLDPFAKPEREAAAWDPPANAGADDQVMLPMDFDPTRPDETGEFQGPTRSDHLPSFRDAFRPAPAPIPCIPDDLDLGTGSPASVSTPLASALAPPQARPTAPASTPEPVSKPATPSPTASQPSSDLLAAFLRGAGMAPTSGTVADPVQTMEALGAAFRATVAGIRQALIARTDIKREFRIDQTLVQARGNNPLKFSADDDDALAALLGIGRATMPAAQAIDQALGDMRLHELASMAAMQVAVRALLAQLAPASIEAKVAGGALTKLLGQRKARAWDAFEALHGTVAVALSDDFDSVFGKAFARAYEQAMTDLACREDLT